MRIRRYVGKTMPDAVAQVRADFGRDAVILQTRRVRERGLWGLLGRRRVEVLAALESKKTRRRREEQAAARVAARPAPKEPPPAANAAPGVRLAPAAEEAPSASPFFDVLEANMVSVGLADREVQDVMAEMRRAVADGVLVDPARGDGTWNVLLTDLLARRLHTVEPWSLQNPPHYHALIGPTGVGKTTTVAKLAANYALIYQKRVGLIATDTFRIGAVAQLRQYAELLDAPLAVVHTPEEMQAAARDMQGMDLILIDTVGGSQRDAGRLGEIRELLHIVPGVEAHLVLSATTRVPDLEDIIRRFSPLGYTTVIVTKTDETTCPATVYNAARLADRPLSFLTGGQAVPEDIEVARPLHVARSIVEEVQRRITPAAAGLFPGP